MPITVELERPPRSEDIDFSRIDLEFRGVDHAGPSFEARVFLNNPSANEETPRNADEGFAGSFYVFGHGGCFGDIGHCDIPRGPRDAFDRRRPHPLTPQFKTVVITEALRGISATAGETFTVTVVAVVPENPIAARGMDGDPLKFDSVSLLMYEMAQPGPQPPELMGL